VGVSASVRLRVEVERFDPWRRLLLPMVFGVLEGGVYLGCVSSSGVEDGGFVCLFFSWAGGSLRCVVSGGARMRETASHSWNKVLRASLFFAVVRSGGGVGSMSLCIGVLLRWRCCSSSLFLLGFAFRSSGARGGERLSQIDDLMVVFTY